ncbi:MAG: response regulator, partial [Anaerolineae bacterium]|nr:response regulator [Anaerolineae bacterium]
MQTVLVVDDEITFLDILKIVLRRAGFQVLTAMDGQEGLDLIYEHRPHLVVLDDMLPSVSGGDICLTIKQDP